MFKGYKDKILLVCLIGVLLLLSLRDRAASQPSFDFENEQADLAEEVQTEELEDIVIHITGQVKEPGVYEFDQGDRIKDAVDAAGGFTSDAFTDGVNLATRLEDEMKVYIPDQEEGEKSLRELEGLIEVVDSDKININTASKEDLMDLPGVGDKTAEKIIAYREEKNFKEIDEIKEVSGIGDKMYEEIKERIRVR